MSSAPPTSTQPSTGLPGPKPQPEPPTATRPSTGRPSNDNRVVPRPEPEPEPPRATRPNAAANEDLPTQKGGTSSRPGASAPAAGTLARAASEEAAAATIAQEVVLFEERLEQQELAQLAQPIVAAAGTRKGGGAPASTRGTSSVNKAISSAATRDRGAYGSSRALSPPITLDEALCHKVGLSKADREFALYVARIWVERNRALKHIKDPYVRGRKAHIQTQEKVLERYPRSIAEEPTGVSGPGLKIADLMRLPRKGVVPELKPWAYTLPDGSLVTSREAIGAGVPTIQIQAYEILHREMNRPVVVITASGRSSRQILTHTRVGFRSVDRINGMCRLQEIQLISETKGRTKPGRCGVGVGRRSSQLASGCPSEFQGLIIMSASNDLDMLTT